MNIGILIGNTGNIRSGIGNYIFNLINQLKNNREINITLIAHKKTPEFENINEIFPNYPAIRYNSILWSNIISVQRQCFSGLDIIHNPAHFPLLRKPGKKYISTIHDLTAVINPEWHQLHRVISTKFLLPKLILDSERIITISHHSKNDLIRYYRVPEQKIDVTYLGASKNYTKLDDQIVNSIKKKYNLNFPFVLSVGTLEPRKNIPSLIRAFALIRKKIPELKLVIVGQKGWGYANIFRMLTDLNLVQDVIFLQYLPHEDLPAIYNAAALFVYPSLYEGFGLPPLEAMQCGIPVITSNTSSLPEIMGDSGIMVDPLDIDDLADKMSLLLTDDQLRRENIRYNLSRSRQFSWEKCAQQTTEIFKDVCNKT